MEPIEPTQPLTIRLEPTGQTLPTAPDQTLWQALQQAGVVWPVSCRNGTCRACMGRLVAGRVRYTVAWPGLLPEEKAAGCVLPCVACAQTDVVLLGPGA
ncbi:2Fe-2S iron-sulfur cluster-binding protein [Hydrogenophaga sp.]|uniref:2Fe-2S iron-sulfur cluster-binding protein n=1 Tax=Hydrogenophaga sp. TaxID=1904254 RepID=UPI003F6AE57E